jgi:hypothetical protein
MTRFDMDVARTAVEAVEQGRIDQADDRTGVVADLVQGKNLFSAFRLLDQLQLEILGDLPQQPLAALVSFQDFLQAGFGSHRQDQRHADVQGVILAAQGQEEEAGGQFRGDFGQQVRVGHEAVQIDIVEMELPRQGPGQVPFGEAARFDAGLAETDSFGFGPGQQLLELFGVDDALVAEDAAEGFPPEVHNKSILVIHHA